MIGIGRLLVSKGIKKVVVAKGTLQTNLVVVVVVDVAVAVVVDVKGMELVVEV